MATIVLADDGVAFDASSPETRPLGGAETAVVSLVRALAGRGHRVTVCNNCERATTEAGVEWRPIASGLPETADLYIANRGDKLIGLVPKARRRAFWIHNPAGYLLKWRYLSALARHRPTIVFIGRYHRGTYPAWAPGGLRVVIPYGIPDIVRDAVPRTTLPRPRAIFASNPLRSLDWILDLWAKRIRPRMPGAELHLYAGAATYGTVGAAKVGPMQAILDRAHRLEGFGVVLRKPVPKGHLVEALKDSRVMLYRGDREETFCSAVAEAQALGVPAVVQDLGSMAERVANGETGFVAADAGAFADAALALLADDDLWRRQHDAALRLQRRRGWSEAAAEFERLLP